MLMPIKMTYRKFRVKRQWKYTCNLCVCCVCFYSWMFLTNVSKSNHSSMILIHKLHCFPTNLPLFLLKRFWTLAVDQPPFPSRLFVFVVRKRLVHSDAMTHQITTCRQFYKTGINTRRTWLQNILLWERVVAHKETISNNFDRKFNLKRKAFCIQVWKTRAWK